MSGRDRDQGSRRPHQPSALRTVAAACLVKETTWTALPTTRPRGARERGRTDVAPPLLLKQLVVVRASRLMHAMIDGRLGVWPSAGVRPGFCIPPVLIT
eukprot:scaffold233868_cov45-Prasinocladus_malaysianus.AAC.1